LRIRFSECGLTPFPQGFTMPLTGDSLVLSGILGIITFSTTVFRERAAAETRHQVEILKLIQSRQIEMDHEGFRQIVPDRPGYRHIAFATNKTKP
jgi:hypothetical protein